MLKYILYNFMSINFLLLYLTINDGMIFIDYEKSYFVKTYKSVKTAENLAKKLKIKQVFYT